MRGEGSIMRVSRFRRACLSRRTLAGTRLQFAVAWLAYLTLVCPPSFAAESAVAYRGTICTSCCWESVIAGDPENAHSLAFVSVGTNRLYRSTDGGRTWTGELLSDVTDLNYPVGLMPGWDPVDPKIFGRPGAFSLVVMAYDWVNATWRTHLVHGAFSGRLQGFVLPGRCHDRPRVAFDPDLGRTYVSINHVVFDTEGTCSEVAASGDNTLFWTDDGGASFASASYAQYVRPTSLAVPSAGALYGASEGPYPYRSFEFWRFLSLQPIALEQTVLTGGDVERALTAWTSNQQTRTWTVFGLPEVLIDRGAHSPNQGRIYVVTSEAQWTGAPVATDYDIVVRYSDDRVNWTAVRVNDDVGGGDQVFPSAAIDSNGGVHIAFADHRDNQDQEVFDVYYSRSNPGTALSFGRNLRLTEAPVPIASGSRPIGDYLDMTVAYPDRAYVAYPCGGVTADACFAEIVEQVDAACASDIVVRKPRLTLHAEPFALSLRGEAVFPKPWEAIDPAANGMRVVVDGRSGSGGLDVSVPGGAGWRFEPTRRRWTYVDRMGSVGGITRIAITDRSAREDGLVAWNVVARGTTLELPSANETRSAIHLGSANECAMTEWNGPNGAPPRCQGNASRLRCR
jgi:hypothetical protein